MNFMMAHSISNPFLSFPSLQEEKLVLSTFVSLFENELQLEPSWVRICRFRDNHVDSSGG
jgi:hypothetical protein